MCFFRSGQYRLSRAWKWSLLVLYLTQVGIYPWRPRNAGPHKFLSARRGVTTMEIENSTALDRAVSSALDPKPCFRDVRRCSAAWRQTATRRVPAALTAPTGGPGTRIPKSIPASRRNGPLEPVGERQRRISVRGGAAVPLWRRSFVHRGSCRRPVSDRRFPDYLNAMCRETEK